MKKLKTPFAYLKIKHKEKRFYDLWLPLIAIVSTAVFIGMADYELKLTLGKDGLILAVQELIKLLSGFFIASLAAVASFANPDMDKKMRGSPPTLIANKKRPDDIEKLSRRRFLSFLFGFLSASSILLYLSISLIPLFNRLTQKTVNPSTETALFLSWIALIAFGFWFFHLISTTFLGLHFITDRVHRGQPPTETPPT